jgi:hypothetical protein
LTFYEITTIPRAFLRANLQAHTRLDAFHYDALRAFFGLFEGQHEAFGEFLGTFFSKPSCFSPLKEFTVVDSGFVCKKSANVTVKNNARLKCMTASDAKYPFRTLNSCPLLLLV